MSTPQWSIFTLPDRLQQEYRLGHGRMTDVVAFELPMTEASMEAFDEGEHPWQPGQALPSLVVPSDLRAAVEDELADGTYAYHQADSGRGASGWGVSVEVMGLVADAGGVGAVLAVAAQTTRKLYRRLTTKLGRRPLVSLGSASFLAAADLADRLGDDKFDLYGRGDASSHVIDAAYAGEGFFYVNFLAHDEKLHSYLVDSYGRLTYMGSVHHRLRWEDDGTD